MKNKDHALFRRNNHHTKLCVDGKCQLNQRNHRAARKIMLFRMCNEIRRDHLEYRDWLYRHEYYLLQVDFSLMIHTLYVNVSILCFPLHFSFPAHHIPVPVHVT